MGYKGLDQLRNESKIAMRAKVNSYFKNLTGKELFVKQKSVADNIHDGLNQIKKQKQDDKILRDAAFDIVKNPASRPDLTDDQVIKMNEALDRGAKHREDVKELANRLVDQGNDILNKITKRAIADSIIRK